MRAIPRSRQRGASPASRTLHIDSPGGSGSQYIRRIVRIHLSILGTSVSSSGRGNQCGQPRQTCHASPGSDFGF
ncbi:MAG TPA: hypothetical protein PK416_11975, partial [Thermodesulfobacteriota bacterium]|nr:hypothetical protein [Thermodesulfobacteriota bacterium]